MSRIPNRSRNLLIAVIAALLACLAITIVFSALRSPQSAGREIDVSTILPERHFDEYAPLIIDLNQGSGTDEPEHWDSEKGSRLNTMLQSILDDHLKERLANEIIPNTQVLVKTHEETGLAGVASATYKNTLIAGYVDNLDGRYTPLLSPDGTIVVTDENFISFLRTHFREELNLKDRDALGE